MSNYNIMDQVSVEKEWSLIQANLLKWLNNFNEKITAEEWMSVFSKVFELVSTNRSNTNPNLLPQAELYNYFKNFLVQSLEEQFKKVYEKNGLVLLKTYRIEWDFFFLRTKLFAHLFRSLSIWIKRSENNENKTVNSGEAHQTKSSFQRYSIDILCLILWDEIILVRLKEKLVNTLLSLIEKEREGEMIDTCLIQSVINSLIILGSPENPLEIYEEYFSKNFIAVTKAYYKAESDRFVASNSIVDYLRKITCRLEQEEKRVKTYLHASTQKELIETVEQVLIESKIDYLIPVFPSILQTDCESDVARMYAALSRVNDGVVSLRASFESYVRNVCESKIEAVTDTASNNPVLFVNTLLQLYKKYNQLVINAFKNDATFVAALDRACSHFVNTNSISRTQGFFRVPELISKYCDLLLKKSIKSLPEQETLDMLNDVMLIFKYIDDKDIFQTYYSKMLAKRLILNTSTSEYLEDQMISKLKQNCGYEYTSKLTRMFNDVALSKQLMERFMTSGEADKNSKINVMVMVLATNSWPLKSVNTTFLLPNELVNIEEAYSRFYENEFSGRKLTWLHHLAKGEIKSHCLNSSSVGYTFQCSLYQMSVLLQFNNALELTTKEIQAAINLNDVNLCNIMLSLVKAKILITNAEGEDIKPENVFTINLNYKSRRNRILINKPVRQNKVEKQFENEQHIEEQRRTLVQAAIVRIMKGRKSLNHASLVSEVILMVQTRFKPSVPFIKKCIDVLIEKEYLDRSESQSDCYTYRA